MRSRRFLSNSLRAISTLSGVLLMVGCNSGTPVGRVAGVVTYDGKPLAKAEVEFTPQGEGTSSVGFTNEEGEYELQYTLKKKGARLGKHTVRVQLLIMNPQSQAEIRYASQTAKIECEVAKGSNEIDIELPGVDFDQIRKERRAKRSRKS